MRQNTLRDRAAVANQVRTGHRPTTHTTLAAGKTQNQDRQKRRKTARRKRQPGNEPQNENDQRQKLRRLDEPLKPPKDTR